MTNNMSNIYFEECGECGHKTRLYAHVINKPMVSALAQGYVKKKPFNLQQDLKLTKNQYNNFQKLQYFDLVEKVVGTTNWTVTERGKLFLRGEITIENKAFTFGKRVIASSSPMIERLKPVIKMVHAMDIVKTDYQKLHDYVYRV